MKKAVLGLFLLLGVAFAPNEAQAKTKENIAEARVLRIWMEDRGAFLNPNLIVTDESPTTLSRGLTTIAPIKQGDALFKIPGPILYTDAKAKGTYGKEFVKVIKETKKGDEKISDLHWTLGVALAAERARGNSSEYRFWIQSLPSKCPNPWCISDINDLARIPYNPGFEDPLPLSTGPWAQLTKSAYDTYERAQRIVELLRGLDIPTEEPKKKNWWGEKPKKNKGSKAAAIHLVNLTTSDVLWGLGMVSSRNWRTQNSFEDAERLGLAYLLMIPYVDMPNHSQTSRDSLTVMHAEKRIEKVEDSFDNLEPFQFVLTAGKDYSAGEEIFITYKSETSRTQDALWVFEYGMVIPGNDHNEFTMSISLNTEVHKRVKEVLEAAAAAGLTPVIFTGENGLVTVKVSLRMDQMPPPWYFGLSRALYAATTFSNMDNTVEPAMRSLVEKEFADLLDKKVLLGQQRAMTSKYDATTAGMVRNWINDVMKNEAQGSYDFDRYLDKAKDMFSKGKDMEGIFLLMHYNGLLLLEKNSIMMSRVYESLSNVDGEAHLAAMINKHSFAGPDWQQALKSQKNSWGSRPVGGEKDGDGHNSHNEL